MGCRGSIMKNFKELFEDKECKSKTLFDDARKAWNKYKFNEDTGSSTEAKKWFNKAQTLFDCIKNNHPEGLPSNHNLPKSLLQKFNKEK